MGYGDISPMNEVELGVCRSSVGVFIDNNQRTGSVQTANNGLNPVSWSKPLILAPWLSNGASVKEMIQQD